MADDFVQTKYCDTQHKTLDSRMDRIDSRLFWILTFVVITAVGFSLNLVQKIIDRGMSAQASTQASTKGNK
jgi:hypothetical protein